MPLSEPEPDAAIVFGSKDDYRDHHPSSADVACVIEVADSSLPRDRTLKLRIYAAAKVPRYVIINLVDRVVEVYAEPKSGRGGAARYDSAVTLQPGDHVELPAVPGRILRTAVRKLLP